MARYETAAQILQDVAPEVGLPIESTPYSATGGEYVQLRALLNIAGRELGVMHNWEIMKRVHTIVTSSGDDPDTGYALPDDFSHMIPQTGWNQTQNVPMGGSLTDQVWESIAGRDLASTSIYLHFKVDQNRFYLQADPIPDAQTITFRYMSVNWARDPTSSNVWIDRCQRASDVVYYDNILISRYLKLKFLESKGFDTTKAQDDFNQIYALRTGQNFGGAPILNAGGRRGGFPYLDAYRNVPDTGYGV